MNKKQQVLSAAMVDGYNQTESYKENSTKTDSYISTAVGALIVDSALLLGIKRYRDAFTSLFPCCSRAYSGAAAGAAEASEDWGVVEVTDAMKRLENFTLGIDSMYTKCKPHTYQVAKDLPLLQKHTELMNEFPEQYAEALDIILAHLEIDHMTSNADYSLRTLTNRWVPEFMNRYAKIQFEMIVGVDHDTRMATVNKDFLVVMHRDLSKLDSSSFKAIKNYFKAKYGSSITEIEIEKMMTILKGSPEMFMRMYPYQTTIIGAAVANYEALKNLGKKPEDFQSMLHGANVVTGAGGEGFKPLELADLITEVKNPLPAIAPPEAKPIVRVFSTVGEEINAAKAKIATLMAGDNFKLCELGMAVAEVISPIRALMNSTARKIASFFTTNARMIILAFALFILVAAVAVLITFCVKKMTDGS